MDDDELRERLRAMPEPSTTIDVDAVVADARRRRRPKVVGVGVAAVAGCLAFLAPVVVPGLLGPDPVTATLQEAGVAEDAPTSESGADAASQAPEQSNEQAPDVSVLGGDAESRTCAIADSSALGDLLYVAFGDDPTDGQATLVVTNRGTADASLTIGDVGLALLGTSPSGVSAASDLDLASASGGVDVEVPAGETVRLDVVVDAVVSSCDGADPDGLPAPYVVAAVDGEPLATPVVGVPWQG